MNFQTARRKSRETFSLVLPPGVPSIEVDGNRSVVGNGQATFAADVGGFESFGGAGVSDQVVDAPASVEFSGAASI